MRNEQGGCVVFHAGGVPLGRGCVWTLSEVQAAWDGMPEAAGGHVVAELRDAHVTLATKHVRLEVAAERLGEPMDSLRERMR